MTENVTLPITEHSAAVFNHYDKHSLRVDVFGFFAVLSYTTAVIHKPT